LFIFDDESSDDNIEDDKKINYDEDNGECFWRPNDASDSKANSPESSSESWSSDDDDFIIKRNTSKPNASILNISESEDDSSEDVKETNVKSTTWTCAFCTFINKTMQPACEVCENPNTEFLLTNEIKSNQSNEVKSKECNPIMAVDEKETKKDETVGMSRECVICYDAMAVMIILPCFHLCLCEKCTPPFRKSSKVCPKCRTRYRQIKKTF